MYSGAGFHCAFHHATQQAFLEAHEKAFQYFGGVFAKLRYDNLGSAVKKILRGRQRVETERWHGFRSHWGFEGSYCNPGRGNEKGGVKGELGWFRRNLLVPVPEASELERRHLSPLATEEFPIHELLYPLLAEELQQYERPMPVMDNYDLLLAANTTGAIQ